MINKARLGILFFSLKECNLTYEVMPGNKKTINYLSETIFLLK